MTGAKGLAEWRREKDPTYEVEDVSARFERLTPKGTKRFIVTAAQNATPVEPVWWRILENIAGRVGAELIVIPLRYKNPTSHWSGSQRNAESWAREVRPYLCNVLKVINNNLVIQGDIKIQPTASSPLTGAETISLASSGILGHTKMQLRTIPTPANRMAKILTTTGVCTVANYTDSRAGRIAAFHHSLSALIVEVQSPRRFHIRQLHYDKRCKSCIDLDTLYMERDARRAPRALALAMGDTHVHALDPAVDRATFGVHGIVAVTNPGVLVWHDLLDGYSVNPHHTGDPFAAIAKLRGNAADARSEVARAIHHIRTRTGEETTSVVVPSNHDAFLKRWIMNTDWRQQPANAEFYLETALAMVRGTKLGRSGTEYPDPFAYWIAQANLPRTRVLALDESFTLGGVELGMHGDRGPNGARGSIRNLRRIGTKSIIGHTHTPGIDEGCYQTGTSTHLLLEYNHGASGWLNTHCLLLANGKRQLINIIDGHWRLC